jgi:hypothetical protein
MANHLHINNCFSILRQLRCNKLIRLKALLLFFMMSFALTVFASHFRGGTLVWQQNGGRSIKFTLNTSWRLSYYKTFYDPNLHVGETVPLQGGNFDPELITFGDGNSAQLLVTVASIDVAADIVNTTFTIIHTYNNDGNFTVDALNDIARISGSGNDKYNLETVVNVTGSAPFNNPPVSSLPSVINVAIGQPAATFTIPASDPDGDAVSFRLSTTLESGLPTPAPAGLSLSSSTGVVTLNTTNTSVYTVGGLYAVQVMLSDGKSKTPVDFLIHIVNPSSPPVFTLPATNPTTFTAPIGSLLSFTVAAKTNDPARTVTLTPIANPPSGSTMTPTLPTSGPVGGTVSSTFNWTPTAAQAGTYVLTFVAQNDVSLQTLKSVTITVPCALDFTATTTPATCKEASDGAASVTVSNNSAESNLSYAWTGPNGFTATTKDLANVLPGTYSLKVTDAATGCIRTHQVDIVVNDVTPPKLTPAPNQDVNLNGSCSVTIPDVRGTATDNCAGVTITQSPDVGAVVSSSHNGIINVTVTATDASGLTDVKTVVLTAKDVTPPTVEHPADITKDNDQGICGATIAVSTPGASDNCAGTQVNGVRSDGQLLSAVYPVGTTTITWTATDAAGLTDTYMQSVTVKDAEKPVISGVPDNIVVYTGDGRTTCDQAATWTPPTATDNCSNPVAISSTHNPGDVFPAGAPTTVKYTFTDAAGNSSECSFTVTVIDNTKPVINVTDPTINANNDPDACSATVNVPTAMATDNCSVGTPIGTRSDGLPLSDPYPIGSTTITWNVSDANGNAADPVIQTVIVTDNQKPVITQPSDISVNNDLNVCGAAVSVVAPGASDNCGTITPVGTRSDGQPLDALYPVGTTTITWTAKDAADNAAAPVVQKVTVSDKQAPVITQPTAITVSNDEGVCGATVNITAPGVNDNCNALTAVGTRSDGQPLNAVYPVGTTVITWTAKDASDNLATPVQQKVTVSDKEAPVYSGVPSDITVYTGTGHTTCDQVATWIAPTATDNCSSPVSINSTKNSGDIFPVGQTKVTYTFTDAAGNSSTASFMVTVIDNTKPVITTNGNKSVSIDPNTCSAAVSVSASATDNCFVGSPSGARSDGKPLTAPYPIGTTTITWTVTDANGNAADPVVQTVTVTDNQAPVITNVSVTPTVLWPPNHQMIDITVNYTVTDNCPGTTSQLNVSSNEPDNGLGDGDMPNDIQVIDDHHVKLRAERSGKGNGRVYTITIKSTDAGGNSTTTQVTVSVPKNQSAPVTTNSSNSRATMQEIVANATFIIAPNPSSGRFVIQFNNYKSSRVNVIVTNMKGAEVERREVAIGGIAGQTLSMDLHHLAAGMYMVRVVSEDGVQTSKVVVQN